MFSTFFGEKKNTVIITCVDSVVPQGIGGVLLEDGYSIDKEGDIKQTNRTNYWLYA